MENAGKSDKEAFSLGVIKSLGLCFLGTFMSRGHNMDILYKLFGEVLKLEDWLRNVTGLYIQNDQYEKCLKDFDNIYVGCQSSRKQFTVVSLSQHSHQYEIILRTIQKILKKREVFKNVLTFGFSTISDNPNASTWQNIESKYPNTSVKVLQSSPWKALLTWIGDETMLYMLEHLSIFMEVKPTCFVQLTGTPVYELWSFEKGSVLKLEKTIKPKRKKQIQKKSKSDEKQLSRTEKENTEGISLQATKKITFKQMITMKCVVGKGYDSLIERSKNYAKLKNITNGKIQNIALTDGKVLDVVADDGKVLDMVGSDGISLDVVEDDGTLSYMATSKEKLLDVAEGDGRLKDNAASYGKLTDMTASDGNFLDAAASNGKLQNKVHVPTYEDLCIAKKSLAVAEKSIVSECRTGPLEILGRKERNESSKINSKVQYIHLTDEQKADSDDADKTGTDQCLNTDLHIEAEPSTCQYLDRKHLEESERMETESAETVCNFVGNVAKDRGIEEIGLLETGSVDRFKRQSENLDRKSVENYGTFSSCKRKRILEEFDLPARKKRKCSTNEIEGISKSKTCTLEGGKNSPNGVRILEDKEQGLQNTEGKVEVEHSHPSGNSVLLRKINRLEHLPPPQTSNNRPVKASDYTFKPFNPMVILPRKKIMYNVNIREKIPKSALVSRFKYSPDGLLALYKSIFVDATEVSNSRVAVVPHPQSDVEATFDKIASDLDEGTGNENENAVSTEFNVFVKVVPDSSVAAGSDRRILPVLSQFLKNLQKCPYKTLLNHYCPVSARFDHRKRPRTARINGKGFYKRQVQKEDVSRHLNEHVHKRQVYLFLRSCVQRILPVQIIGSVRNRNLILKRISECLSMGKYDKVSLGQLMTGIKTKNVDWLQDIKSNSCRLYLLSRLVYWLFVNVIFVLLRTMFYITDTTFLRYKLLYYRQVVWNRINVQGLNGLLKRKTLKPMAKSKVQELIQSKESLGVSTLRFLPKQKSLRPIVNMGVTSPEFSLKKLSVNKQLTDLHLVLTYLKDRNQSLVGHGKLGSDEIYCAWNHFKQKWRGQGQPNLYFVKTDIARCYDSIHQPKLFQIMEKIFEEELADEELMITRYVTVSCKGGIVRRRFRRKVFSLCDFEPDIEKHAKNLLGNETRTILVDKMCHHFETGKGLLNVLNSHCFVNIIKHGSKYFLHTEGISQGSVISTLLCNFYYADMERKLFTVKDSEFLVRIVDDYLFVTPDQQSAVNFLNCMLNGIPEYNCHTNTEKVLINFHHDVDEKLSVHEDDWFPWCGMLFNTKTLEVAVDYDRYTGTSVSDTMTFDLTHNPGRAMKEKLVYSVQQKCHRIYIDPAINTEDQILTNLFHMFVFASLKLHAIVKKMPSKGAKGVSLTLLEDIISSLSSSTMSKLNSFKHSDRWQTIGLHSHTNQAVRWLCLHAFIITLNQHKAQYSVMLKSLQKWCIKSEIKMPREIVAWLRSTCGTELPGNFKLMLN